MRNLLRCTYLLFIQSLAAAVEHSCNEIITVDGEQSVWIRIIFRKLFIMYKPRIDNIHIRVTSIFVG